MTWQYKMGAMVEDVLNEDCNEPIYKFHFDGEQEFYVERNGVRVFETKTIQHLPSHWKRYANSTIIQIIEAKIERYLNHDNRIGW